jgi:putative CocE/NonD family hydrolase
MMLRQVPLRIAKVIVLLFAWLSCAATAPAGPITAEFNVRIPMRDGATLSADIYRPAGPGRFPVVLVRTPYLDLGTGSQEDGQFWAEHGYAYVIQDVRGRGSSDGSFYPLVHEANDGYDTQTWLGTQPWSSGRVGTLGSSYLGWTQVYTAGLNNPHLAAMVPTVAPPDPFRNIPYQHGVFSPTLIEWLVLLDGHVLQKTPLGYAREQLRSLPLADMDRLYGRRLPAWHDWVAHPALDDYWAAQSYQDNYLKSRVPGLHVTGWYDDVLIGTLENYANLTTRAVDPAARKLQWLIVGPWPHAVDQGRSIGQVDFGPTAVIGLRDVELQWFDHWLKGIDNGMDREPHVRIFVMGANRWRTENEWPMARTRYVKFFLHSSGKANTLRGDGVLSPDEPAPREPADQFTYDPADPVPFVTPPTFAQLGGPDDYREVEHRQDVLVYTSTPFGEPTEVCGPLRVHLVAASSARDTDWTAKVVDVHPDGYAQRLNDGIVRARFRHSDSKPQLLTPGKAEAYEIDAWATCIELQAGHRLRLEISSSEFPKFMPNLNTGEDDGTGTQRMIAAQTVFHDKARPSYVVVPIVPAGK